MLVLPSHLSRVDDNLPSVTVLIAARLGQVEVKAIAASRALDYPAGKVAIILARGRQPSVQRNAGLKAARGELIYFLDDDSMPEAGSLRRAVPPKSRPPRHARLVRPVRSDRQAPDNLDRKMRKPLSGPSACSEWPGIRTAGSTFC